MTYKLTLAFMLGTWYFLAVNDMPDKKVKKPQIGDLFKSNEEPLDHLFETNALKRLGLKAVDTGDKFQAIVSLDAIPCFKCGEWFVPDPQAVKSWVASNREWDIADWQCQACKSMDLPAPRFAPIDEDRFIEKVLDHCCDEHDGRKTNKRDRRLQGPQSHKAAAHQACSNWR